MRLLTNFLYIAIDLMIYVSQANHG